MLKLYRYLSKNRESVRGYLDNGWDYTFHYGSSGEFNPIVILQYHAAAFKARLTLFSKPEITYEGEILPKDIYQKLHELYKLAIKRATKKIIDLENADKAYEEYKNKLKLQEEERKKEAEKERLEIEALERAAFFNDLRSKLRINK